MADRAVRWRPATASAGWALDYYREFFSQFAKIRFVVDVNSRCDDFSLELAKLSDRFLGIGLSNEGMEDAKKEAKEKGCGEMVDFRKETLTDLWNRLTGGDIRSLPDFVTACNAFSTEQDQEEGVQLMSDIVRPGGGILILSVSILEIPNIDPAAFLALHAFVERANARSGHGPTSVDPKIMLDDQKLHEELIEVPVSRGGLEKGLRTDLVIQKWRNENPQELEKEMAAMLDRIWSFAGSQENVTLRLNCFGKFGRKIIF